MEDDKLNTIAEISSQQRIPRRNVPPKRSMLFDITVSSEEDDGEEERSSKKKRDFSLAKSVVFDGYGDIKIEDEFVKPEEDDCDIKTENVDDEFEILEAKVKAIREILVHLEESQILSKLLEFNGDQQVTVDYFLNN